MKFLEEFLGTKKYKLLKLDYDSYWSTRRMLSKSNLKIKRRDILIKEQIYPGASVLDIGCGDGRLIYFLQTTNKNECKGLDVSKRAIFLAKKSGVRAARVKNLVEALKHEGKYDYVILSEFIEHISDPESVLKEVSKIFKKAVIITIPNIGHLSCRLRLLTGRFPECWKWHPGEHVRFWTKVDFEKWIVRSDNNFMGLRVRKFINIEGTPILGDLIPSLFSYNLLALITK